MNEQIVSLESQLKDQLTTSLDINRSSQKDQERLLELTVALEKEKSERVTILLKNAELTQNEENLKQDLKQERDEMEELLEQIKTLQRRVIVQEKNEKDLILEIEGLNLKVHEKESQEEDLQKISEELKEKNKTIKVLNQRLVDMKKTLQEEISGNRSQRQNDEPETVLITTSNGLVTMDEVSFKYLKHVIMKFVTCRDVEAKHLIRAVSTILQLNSEEVRLLDEMYKWKMSWFFGGSRPDVGQWSS